MKAILINSEEIAPNIRTFTFQTDEAVSYRAGQYIQMILPHPDPDDRGVKRWFTVSASPTEGHIAITTKFAGDKASSFKKYLFSLKPEDNEIIEMVPPEGDFTLPNDLNLELVFVAGGIGITPYHSIVQWLKDMGEQRKIKLLYAAANEESLIFMDLFKSYECDVTTVVGEPLTANEVMKVTGDPNGKLVYISGPEPLIEKLEKELGAAGLPKDALKTDFFPGYTQF